MIETVSLLLAKGLLIMWEKMLSINFFSLSSSIFKSLQIKKSISQSAALYSVYTFWIMAKSCAESANSSRDRSEHHGLCKLKSLVLFSFFLNQAQRCIKFQKLNWATNLLAISCIILPLPLSIPLNCFHCPYVEINLMGNCFCSLLDYLLSSQSLTITNRIKISYYYCRLEESSVI